MINKRIDYLVAVCKEYGVKDVCIGAGSRSTAIIQALDKNKISIHPFLDERAVGFLALGIAKVTHRPVMIVTTSGSAVSNLYPAITEAANSHYNLIVCTADRPSNLQTTSSNQTINQVGVFNNVVAEVQMPESDDQLDQFKDKLAMAFQAQSSVGGPVHINCPLEDPVMHPYTPNIMRVSLEIEQPISGQGDAFSSIQDKVSHSNCGVLLIGQCEPWIKNESLVTLVETLGWTTIVDATHHYLKSLPNVAHSADMAIDEMAGIEFDCVLYIGGPWVSKKMAVFMAHHAEKIIHITESYRPLVNLKRQSMEMSVSELKGLTSNMGGSVDIIGDINRRSSDKVYEKLSKDSEFKAVYHALLSIDGPIDCFVSNSLPIRYFDHLKLPMINKLYCNRGASGIDGNIATIIGLSLMPTDVPLLGIVGDLAALYDLNSFLMMDKVRRPLTIIIINNGGGCIFERLPIASSYHKFDEHFKLAHRIQISPILAEMGIKISSIDKTINFSGNVVEIN